MATSTTRRNFLQNSAAAAAVTTAAGATACGDKAQSTMSSAATVTYEDIGVRRVINGRGTVTILGGSVMPPEVVAAMVDAAKSHVSLPDLQQKAGAKIAQMIGVPAAMISCGAASAMTCGTAACLHRGDRKKANQLPDVTGIPNEIISQKAHRCGYEAQMWLTGARTIWVETREELEKAISDKTAMMFFLNKADPDGQIKRAEWVEVAKKHGIPTLNDAAADVPPKERLKGYVDEGFDLVVFSGGKGLTGPQASGLLLGNADLVKAAWLSISPAGGIGRGMKVGKEEIMGLVAAVERYMRIDHDAERKELDRRAAHIIDTIKDISTVQCDIDVPEIANRVPHVMVRWDEATVGKSARQVVDEMLEGEPSIAISGGRENSITISVWQMQTGEAEIVATRLREVMG
ncbi:MAG TPA: aminotransferase class V-fold PLP-dependent enzyme [Bryobacterales bacterium]|nr:aminotransferase class V-fold PLP-dependent enzyme [Bryobacterales bacterium]